MAKVVRSNRDKCYTKKTNGQARNNILHNKG